MERILLASVLGTLAFYLLGSKRLGYARHKGPWLVNGSILACVIALSFTMPDTTYYDLLQVSPNAGTTEVKRAAQHALATLVKKGIDDPNDAMFVTLKRIGDTLSTRESRRRYNSYGDFFVSGDDLYPESTLFRMITLAALHALFTFVVGYILTTPKPLRHARSMVAMSCLIILVAEIKVRLNGTSTFGLLPFQVVGLLRALFPGATVLAATISDWLHDDSEEILRHQLRGLFQLQHLIIAKSEQITSMKSSSR